MPKKHYSSEDFQKLAMQNVVIQTAASDPTSPAVGQLYFNTGTARYRFYTGTVWYEINTPTSLPPSGAAGGALTGTYPNPTLATNAIDSVLEFTSALRGTAIANGGTAADTGLALRALGSNTGNAMPGSYSLSSIANSTGIGGDISFVNVYKITNLIDPVNPQDVATKSYVDVTAQGLNAKKSVRVATTGNVALTGLQTVDGITLVASDRILVRANTTGSENGIYSASSGSWSRVTDMDTSAEARSAFTFVEEGTTLANTGWVQTSDNVTLGTTALVWAQFSAAGSYTAGSALTLSGLQFNVNYDNTTIGLTGNNLQLKDTSVTALKMAPSAVVLSSTTVTGTLGLANGGTGGTTAATARTSLVAGTIQSILSPALTAGTWTTVTLTSTLLNTYPVIEVYDASTKEKVDIEARAVDTASIQIRSDITLAASALTVSVSG